MKNSADDIINSKSIKVSPAYRFKLASSADTPSRVLDFLAEKYANTCNDIWYTLGETLLCNPKCPKSTLNILSKNSLRGVRCGVARHPNTPPKTLELLATDKTYHVRCWVAYNSNTPPKTLELLATDENADVRRGVANNPNTPKYIKLFFRYKNYLRCYGQN